MHRFFASLRMTTVLWEGIDVRSAILVIQDIVGVLLLTIGIAHGDGFTDGLMVGVSLGMLALVIRERDTWPAWFQDFSLLLWGTSFLIGDWWLVSHGKGSPPVFITFGPGFLLMAAYGFAKRKLAAKS
jgi:hypothetical protein